MSAYGRSLKRTKRCITPALLIKPSTTGCDAKTAWGSASTAALSVMFTVWVERRSILLPAASMVSCSPCALISTAATRAPCFNKARVSSLPMPLPAPVTIMTFDATFMIPLIYARDSGGLDAISQMYLDYRDIVLHHIDEFAIFNSIGSFHKRQWDAEKCFTLPIHTGGSAR